jgi:hypothetical protein
MHCKLLPLFAVAATIASVDAFSPSASLMRFGASLRGDASTGRAATPLSLKSHGKAAKARLSPLFMSSDTASRNAADVYNKMGEFCCNNILVLSCCVVVCAACTPPFKGPS